jgi:hypothetical protein
MLKTTSIKHVFDLHKKHNITSADFVIGIAALCLRNRWFNNEWKHIALSISAIATAWFQKKLISTEIVVGPEFVHTYESRNFNTSAKHDFYISDDKVGKSVW